MLRINTKIFLFLSFVCILSCSSVPKNEKIIKRIIPKQIRMRSPPSPGADPLAGPGGADYKSLSAPHPQFECEKAEKLFDHFDLKKIKDCLLSVKKPMGLLYRLKREVISHLFLIPNSETTQCVKALLSQIPVPREIIYQAHEEAPLEGAPVKRLNCYASRLDLEANEWMGARLPTHRVDIKVWIPLEVEPRSDEELLGVLTSWAITPLWDEQIQGLRAKILPDHLCKKCIGEKEWLKGNEHDIIFWPY
jgi:hypothetical protein